MVELVWNGVKIENWIPIEEHGAIVVTSFNPDIDAGRVGFDDAL